jgi:hypothetical protein
LQSFFAARFVHEKFDPTTVGAFAMDRKLSNSDVYAMFERLGVSPIERDKNELQDLMSPGVARGGEGAVVYRTVLSNGTGQSLQGGKDAELESNAI